jgi:hypothetical protein
MKKKKLLKKIERLEDIIADQGNDIDILLGDNEYAKVLIRVRRLTEKTLSSFVWSACRLGTELFATEGLIPHLEAQGKKNVS